MYKTLRIDVVGVAPLIHHNGQLKDPLNQFAKAMKNITTKRKKTESDYRELAEIEFRGSLYMSNTGPIIPALTIQAALTAGARKSKDGRLAEAGIIVNNHAELHYDGPRTVEGLLADPEFRIVVPCGVQGNAVIRTRPIFRNWSATFEIDYLEEILNQATIMGCVRNSGMYCGVGDWRPRNGRFAIASEVERLSAAA